MDDRFLNNMFNMVKDAGNRIHPYIRPTYLEKSDYYSIFSGANVYFKMENLQFTGSFKTRGAMNKILSLSKEEMKKGVIAASTGNHGLGVAFSLNRLNAKGTIIVPENASNDKIQAIERYGVNVKLYGNDCVVAEARAKEISKENGSTYISPYNDLHVIGGQGTIGIELLNQLKNIDAVFVSLGGGGLISGIAALLKEESPETRIFGCSPENSQVMIQSVKAGKILDLPSLPTLSDGTAGGVEQGSVTFDLCKNLVNDFITVNEEEIRNCLYEFIKTQNILIEGSAAVAIASFLKVMEQLEGKNIVILLCGGNIGMDTLSLIVKKV